MGLIAFDTHAFVKRLTEAGMPEPQAAVLAREQARLIESDLATKRDIEELKRDIAEVKRDIEELRAETKRDIAELRAEVKRDLKDLEQRLTIRLGAMMMGSVTVVAALVKLL